MRAASAGIMSQVTGRQVIVMHCGNGVYVPCTAACSQCWRRVSSAVVESSRVSQQEDDEGRKHHGPEVPLGRDCG